MSTCRDDKLYLLGVNEARENGGLVRLTFHTTRGDFHGLLHTAQNTGRGVIMLGDNNGGLDGPGALYSEIAEVLSAEGISTLTLDFRVPGDCVQCSIDTLIALQYLDDEAIHDVVLIGWSFGGAVALSTGSVAKTVRGIAAISTADVANCCVRRLQSKPILLLHGDADEQTPVRVARRIHDEAVGPRRIIIYPNSGSRLTEVADRVRKDLVKWVVQVLKLPASGEKRVSEV